MLPQLFHLTIMFMGLGMIISKHGEERIGKENAWSMLIAVIISMRLLYWGGFYDVFFKG